MKLFKKYLCTILLVTALFTSVQTTTHAATVQMTFNRWETGTVVISGYDSFDILDKYGAPTGLYYSHGESFYYDSVYNYVNSNTFAVSYISYSGEQRFVLCSYIDQSTGKKVIYPGLTIY